MTPLFGKFHGQSHNVAAGDGIQSEIITEPVKSDNLLKIVDLTVGARQAQCFIFRTFHLCAVDVCKFAAGQRAGRAGPIPAFGSLDGVRINAAAVIKNTIGKITGGQNPGFAHGLHQNRCAVGAGPEIRIGYNIGLFVLGDLFQKSGQLLHLS